LSPIGIPPTLATARATQQALGAGNLETVFPHEDPTDG
jgi:hypothetical protein